MDEFVSCMITDSHARLLLCTSGEGTLTVFNTRAKKMDGQVGLHIQMQYYLKFINYYFLKISVGSVSI